MNKDELINLLKDLGIPFNEGVTSTANTESYPRIVFWDFIWTDIKSSDDAYADIETYQISFYSKEPRHIKLIELRKKLRDKKTSPIIYHEFVENEKVFHSYFSIDIIVDKSKEKNVY